MPLPPATRRFVLACAGVFSALAALPGARLQAGPVEVGLTNFHGWSASWRLANAKAEVVVAPAIGRVMSFRRLPAGENPFWENASLRGRPMGPNMWEQSMGGFGGDKTWPAPQGAWNWPPPDVFDAAELAAAPEAGGVRLTSPVSLRFGIRTVRIVQLDPAEPVLRIRTRYEKIAGPPVEVGVWVITQTRPPEAAFLPAFQSRFKDGFAPLWPLPEPWGRRESGLIEMHRDPTASHKIGNDGGKIAWVGADSVLTIEVSPAAPAQPHADGGCNVEIYTNQDPTPYMELETLGPLARLAVGDSLTATNVYTLRARSGASPVQEALQALRPSAR